MLRLDKRRKDELLVKMKLTEKCGETNWDKSVQMLQITRVIWSPKRVSRAAGTNKSRSVLMQPWPSKTNTAMWQKAGVHHGRLKGAVCPSDRAIDVSRRSWMKATIRCDDDDDEPLVRWGNPSTARVAVEESWHVETMTETLNHTKNSCTGIFLFLRTWRFLWTTVVQRWAINLRLEDPRFGFALS